MISVQVQLAQHGGSLETKTANSRSSWSERHGILVTLRDAQGNVGCGEASPLPNHSPDTLHAAWQALEQLPWSEALQQLRAAEPLVGLAQLDAFLGPEVPAARFAAETALADLEARRRGLPLWAWLGGRRAAPSLELCYLLDLDQTSLEARSDELFRAGVRSFKLKIGRDASAELASLRALRARFGDAIKLRCDANQNFDLVTARAFLTAASALGLEFVEEPVPPAALPALAHSSVPLALDESLRSLPQDGASALDFPAVRALVLKPMLLGGFSACARLAERALPTQTLVFSHLFDGPVAWAATLHAAWAWGSTECAAGLAPHPGLSAWPKASFAAGSGIAGPVSLGAAGEQAMVRLAASAAPGLGLTWNAGPP